MKLSARRLSPFYVEGAVFVKEMALPGTEGLLKRNSAEHVRERCSQRVGRRTVEACVQSAEDANLKGGVLPGRKSEAGPY